MRLGSSTGNALPMILIGVGQGGALGSLTAGVAFNVRPGARTFAWKAWPRGRLGRRDGPRESRRALARRPAGPAYTVATA